MSQSARLADQIRRAFEGKAWHGDSMRELLAGVSARTAAAHPIPGAHSIWELLLHIAAWDNAVIRRAGGSTVTLAGQQNFPPVKDTGEAAWQKAQAAVNSTHDRLVTVVAGFPDSRLQDRVPGKKQDYHDFYYMFSGIVQHELYHAGQIALLKKFSL